MAKAINKKVAQKTRKKQERSEMIARSVAFGLFAFFMLAFAYWQLHGWLINPATLPVKVVRIDGELKYLQKAELENAVAGVVSGGFFNIDLKSVMNKAHELPWVEEVSVKRIWPDTVVMEIREREAIARWGDKHLVTGSGEIFLPNELLPEGLPVLIGMDDRSVEVVELFKREKPRFARLGLKIATLHVNKRGAWSIAFDNGLHIAIGRMDIKNRLRRLADNFVAISQRGNPEYIDLRYRYGIAVSWKKSKGAV
ncbi:MAG: FtsQ-type POTRA domain-containing protein [Gammaproteobacteria bacterium]|nr:FtsQ-type POTRA domain-containing protein [Gammaproteobacteria bacterium]